MNTLLDTAIFKSARESMGISQSKLAKELGINRAYLSQFESGKRLLNDNEIEVIYAYL